MTAKLEATRARQRAMEALADGDLEAARHALHRAAPMLASFGPALAAEAHELRLLLDEIETAPQRARKTLSSQVYRDRKGRKDF
jgi:Ca-activated chloride channel family protein